MGCQRKIVKQIIEQGGDYMLQVADNHPTLHSELKLLFEGVEHDAPTTSVRKTVDRGHGRLEERAHVHSTDIAWFADGDAWAGLASFAAATSTRTNLTTGEVSVDTRYYISSYTSPDGARAGRAIRSHWGIENGLHWAWTWRLTKTGRDAAPATRRRRSPSSGTSRSTS